MQMYAFTLSVSPGFAVYGKKHSENMDENVGALILCYLDVGLKPLVLRRHKHASTSYLKC